MQSGPWVPEASRTLHYWQQAPRWLPNPGNPARCSHVEGTKQAPVTLIKLCGKGKAGTGDGKQPLGGVPRVGTRMLEKSTDNVKLLNALWPESMWNLGTCADLTTADHKGKAYAPYIKMLTSDMDEQI